MTHDNSTNPVGAPRDGRPEIAFDPAAAPSPVPGRRPRPLTTGLPVHPGEVLRDELDKRGMTQADLAVRTGLSPKHINQVLQGLSSISADVAVSLEMILKTPADTWTTLDADWQEYRSRERARDRFSEDAAWAKNFPVAEMIRRGLLTGQERGADLVAALLGLFRVADPEAFQRVWLDVLPGFRRAQHLAVDPYATATWLLLAERQTEDHDLHGFSITRLRAALPKLRALTRLPVPAGFERARALLAEHGVAVAFVEDVLEGRNSGATWWPRPQRPLIVLTARYQKADSFWFSLFHEIAHLLLHPRRAVFVELKGVDGDDADGCETEANSFAADTLIPHECDDEITTAKRGDLRVIARRLDVGTSIVAGRRGQLTGKWAEVEKLREPIDVNGLSAVAASPPS